MYKRMASPEENRWLTQSPKLNLTENLWVHLKRAVGKRCPHNLRDFENFGNKEWALCNSTKSPRALWQGAQRPLMELHCDLLTSCFHREKIHTEQSPPPPEADYSSTTQKDFCVPGFVPSRPKSTRVCVGEVSA
ncbi:hypothetical protein ILYODFUR_038279 [Ilyodon furcidens]|uniref:Uncharacterized protein n=1 Tax=Ilyodon furcidens TaxID=33524 RepID=A0ABV0VA47_9TELE